MKCCCPGVAWVTLAALWLAASESQPPGWRDRAVLQRQRVPVQPLLRLRRHTHRRQCPDSMNWIETAGRCCHPCPAGTFLYEACTSPENRSVCRPCPAGTFRAQPNTLRECQACYECDQHAFQTVLSNCSATRNIACGCEPGRFRVCLDKQCSEFSCQKCQSCTGRLIQQPCSEAQDTLCDSSCKPDFYREGDGCRPCGTRTVDTCGKECQQVCGSKKQGSGLEYILLGLAGPLFLGALAIYHKRKRFWPDASERGPHPMAQPAIPMPRAAATPRCWFNAGSWHNPCWTQPCPPQGTERAAGTAKSLSQALLREPPSDEGEPCAPPEPRGALLQGSQLYAVIDAVPVRRWKEFMRMLELREAEIELVELEVVHIRDQQYEMLKRWCQQTSATLDHVFAALERMELAGCAEALRQSLPVGP
ncbi:tumor necrosis factor receptor superfamily member 25 [Passer domesticus]|uniref:tumor necrosis factor receptor superfamily member 25 n=1 Tax=Passer domesticus TaxID=48849 RepID=UPI0030FEC0EC